MMRATKHSTQTQIALKGRGNALTFTIVHESDQEDQVKREERPEPKRQRTTPGLYDISAIRKKRGGRRFYKELFFLWRKMSGSDDPGQSSTAKLESWKTFVRLENESLVERLLGNLGGTLENDHKSYALVGI
ncbi:hypothetical protein FI667_g8968, partial [Globisporangium splendens]